MILLCLPGKTMKRQLVYISAAILCEFGCSASLDVATVRNTEAAHLITYDEANRYLAGQIATVNLIDGGRVEAEVVAMTSDSTLLFAPQDSLQKAIQTSDIVSVEVTDRTLGTTEGLLFGATIGALVFDVLHTLSENDNSLWSPWLYGIAAGGAPRGAVVGGMMGMLLGYTRGSVIRFNVAGARPR